MNIALLLDKTEKFETQFIPIKIFSSDDPNKLIAIRDLALDVDEAIYIDRLPIDWILYCVNDNIRFEDFAAMAKYIPQDSRTVFLTGDNTLPWEVDGCAPAMLENFYCRPQLFSILGNAYKLKDFSIDLRAESRDKEIMPELTTLVYAINRTGYEIQRIPAK